MKKKDQAERNRKAAAKLEERIARQLKAGAGKGVEAAVRFLAARIKETVSVPAPKKRLKIGDTFIYRATAPAVRGAPPRVLSGRLRQGVTHKMLTPQIGLVGTHARSLPSRKSPGGFDYPRHLELGPSDQWGGGEHQFIRPTVMKWRKELRTLVGSAVKTELRK